MEEAEEAPVVQEPIRTGKDDGDESDEDDGTVYNPLNLPYVSWLLSEEDADRQTWLGRQTDPVLAVQAAWAWRHVFLRDLCRSYISGKKGVRQAFHRGQTCVS
jgi:hypothetical protein